MGRSCRRRCGLSPRGWSLTTSKLHGAPAWRGPMLGLNGSQHTGVRALSAADFRPLSHVPLGRVMSHAHIRRCFIFLALKTEESDHTAVAHCCSMCSNNLQ